MAETKKRGFGDLISLTSDAFNASTAEKEQREEEQTPKMLRIGRVFIASPFL